MKAHNDVHLADIQTLLFRHGSMCLNVSVLGGIHLFKFYFVAAFTKETIVNIQVLTLSRQ